MRKLFICASPRRKGTSAQLTEILLGLERAGDASSEKVLDTFFMSEHSVAGCIACDCCRDDFCCVIEDDMQMLYPRFDAADELVIVSPVYFAGPPAQFKSVLDRLQPYFWRKIEKDAQADPVQKKRPAKLFVIGEALDPHGFAPLVISVRSALAPAGFSLDAVYDARRLSGEALEAFARNPEPYRVEGDACNNPHPPNVSRQEHG